jgi:hypothetical protein
MTHFVEPGRTIALCGVRVGVIGDPWADRDSATALCRCSTCLNASYFMTSGETYP